MDCGLIITCRVQFPGLHVLGEANFSDHGANRLGASALMQGLADGYFVIPYTIGNFIASCELGPVDENHEAFKTSVDECQRQTDKLLSIKGSVPVDEIHRKLGHIMWENVGMSRSRQSLEKALEEIPKLRHEFWNNVKIPGEENYMNAELEKADVWLTFLNSVNSWPKMGWFVKNHVGVTLGKSLKHPRMRR